MSDKIDVHNHERQYLNYKKALEEDASLIAKNKEFILKYLRDSELGKTIRKGQKKKIGSGRNIRVAGILKHLDMWFKKPFDQVTEKDMEDFILKLENGTILSDNKKPYSSETLMTIKKFIRKFWKWLLGESKFYPDIVEWIDTSGKSAEINALPNLKSDIEKMVDLATDYQKKALIYVLFDSGMREGECLNLRLKDVSTMEDTPSVLAVNIRHSKTFSRQVSLPLSSYYLKQWLGLHPQKDDKEASLWILPQASGVKPMTKSFFYNNIKRLGKKALKMNVTPHMLRHTSATYYASRLERGVFVRRYGWSFSSKMPDRYIDWAKLEEKKTVEVVHSDEITNLKKQNIEIKNQMVLQNEQHKFEIERIKEMIKYGLKKVS